MKSHFRENKVFGDTGTGQRSFFRSPVPPPSPTKAAPLVSSAASLTLDSAAELVVRVLAGDTPVLPKALAPAVRKTLATHRVSGKALEALQSKALSLPEAKQLRVFKALADGRWLALL